MNIGHATKNDLNGKYVFWDVDGVLTPFRFCDSFFIEKDGFNKKEKMIDIFQNRAPSKHMQWVISTCGAKENIVLGHVLSPYEVDAKNVFLNNNFPSIKKRIFIPSDNSKADEIIAYCKENSIKITDAVFVDDRHDLLKEAERKGIKSYHISSFLDWKI